MKSCFVRFDRLVGIAELAAPDELHIQDYVLCDLEKGESVGVVISEPAETTKEGLRSITRKVSAEEVSAYASLKAKESQAFESCKKKIEEMKLPMKLLQGRVSVRGNRNSSSISFRRIALTFGSWSKNWQRSSRSGLRCAK